MLQGTRAVHWRWETTRLDNSLQLARACSVDHILAPVCAFALQVTRVAVDKALDELNSSFGSLPLWADKPLIRFEHMSQALSAAFKSPVISLLASLPQVISRSHIH